MTFVDLFWWESEQRMRIDVRCETEEARTHIDVAIARGSLRFKFRTLMQTLAPGCDNAVAFVRRCVTVVVETARPKTVEPGCVAL